MTSVTGSVSTSSMTHIGCVRQKNEDSLLAMPKSGLWAVADGMGGHEAGDYASQSIIRHLQKAGLQYRNTELVNAIPSVLASANKEIYHYAQQHTPNQIIGSTIVVLIIEDENYHCFWSGDSRCYLSREQTFTPITNDHTEAQTLIEQGILTPAQTENSKEANTLTHAIGVDPSPHLDYIKDYIYEEDRFLLCTDGLTKNFSDTTLAEHITLDNIDGINQQFLSKALQAGAPDNLSSIIVSINTATPS
ncbi:Protein serine/threonine phosphatase PrpC, regulation of stationary phase [hydrothermal vent metagenome]|uniref:Protein serine/threonine phosphatase PrpC, regulation of stationary phase n=1 Tax=hydrothermal vent metagenome TaxID=652676 RepID=A0A3B0VR40_9ZZZZ